MINFAELRANSRSLFAVSLGLASGYITAQYVTNIFVPHLLSDFGWTKAQFSIVGFVPLCTLITGPLIGRLTDVFGVRKVAAVGVIGMPLTYIASSAMNGAFSQYFIISLVQILFIASTTTSIVYSRTIAEHFTLTRGLALSIAGSAPAIASAIIVPLLSGFIESRGWRAGYLVMAAGSTICGPIALLLIPRRAVPARSVKGSAETGESKKDYNKIFRDPVFIIVIVGSFLCNLPYFMATTQLMVFLLGKNIASPTAALMVSAFTIMIMVGRFVVGIFLDHYPAQVVVTLALGIPTIGLFVLASSLHTPALIAVSVGLLGLSIGSEINLSPFLATSYFRENVWSLVVGSFAGAMALSIPASAMLLRLTLKLNGDFSLFLFICGCAGLVGSCLFLLLGRLRDPHRLNSSVAVN